MSDLVERLGDMERRQLRVAENMRGDPEGVYNDAATLEEAAAELTRLRAHHESEMKRVDGLLNNYERAVEELRAERDEALALLLADALHALGSDSPGREK